MWILSVPEGLENVVGSTWNGSGSSLEKFRKGFRVSAKQFIDFGHELVPTSFSLKRVLHDPLSGEGAHR